jgi:hypothetical protein
MTNRNVAITIWWRAILLNAFFTGTWAVFDMGIKVILMMIVLVAGGFIVTMPLLPLVSLLLKYQRSIPYAPHVRFAWFRCTMVLIVWLFYTAIQLAVLHDWPPTDWFYYAVAVTTSLSVLTAIAFTKRDIMSLHPLVSSKNSYHLQTLPDV